MSWLRGVIVGTWDYFWQKVRMHKACDRFLSLVDDGVEYVYEHSKESLAFAVAESDRYVVHSDGRIHHHLEDEPEVGCSKGKKLYTSVLSAYVSQI